MVVKQKVLCRINISFNIIRNITCLFPGVIITQKFCFFLKFEFLFLISFLFFIVKSQLIEIFQSCDNYVLNFNATKIFHYQSSIQSPSSSSLGESDSAFRSAASVDASYIDSKDGDAGFKAKLNDSPFQKVGSCDEPTGIDEEEGWIDCCIALILVLV